MDDIYDYLANVVLMIKEDPQLKECFNRILQFGASQQQVQVAALLVELEKLNAPPEVKKFVKLLSNDQLAQQILVQINS